MPIKIPEKLPAFDVLRGEGVNVMSERTALRQDIRPLQIGLLNLMPKKIQTEIQFARLIGATPLQIELTLIRMTQHFSRNTSHDHIEAFYQTFQDVKARKLDGLIITGAPIEHLDFAEVNYWDELCEVFEWTKSHVHSTFGVCWGAMAMMNYFHEVPKYLLDQKFFGCYRQRNLAPSSPYLRGLSDDLLMPVSRWTENKRADILSAGLDILLESDITGPALVENPKDRTLYILNHIEYDATTLQQEFERDLEQNTAIDIPENYFPENDPQHSPLNRWRSHAHLLYGNWISEIYQTTPFHLGDIGQGAQV